MAGVLVAVPAGPAAVAVAPGRPEDVLGRLSAPVARRLWILGRAAIGPGRSAVGRSGRASVGAPW